MFDINGNPTSSFVKKMFELNPPVEGVDYSCVKCARVRNLQRERVRKFRRKALK